MKFKIFLIVCIILAVVAMGILGWQNYKDGYRDGLKKGEVYVVDGTEIYVADEKDYLWVEGDAEIKLAEEGEEGLNIVDDSKAFGTEMGTYIQDTEFTMHAISFYEGDEMVGILEWGDGVFVFKGRTKQSAHLFFEHFLKGMVDDYIVERLKEDKDD